MKIHLMKRLATVLCVWLLGMESLAAGVMAKEISFLDLSDFTGPVAGLALPGSMGLEDYLKDVNERGGIEGLKVKYIGVDTRYDVARALSAYKRYRRDKSVLCVNIVSTPLGKMLERLTRREKLVIMIPGDGEFQAHPGNFFPWGPVYQNAFSATIDWILSDWKKKGMSGAPKVAVLSWDSAYGREMLRGGKEYAEQNGVEILPSELFPVGSLKHDIYLNRLSQAGANYVYVGGVDPVQTNVMRDAKALGLTDKIQFISDYWGPTTLGTSLHPDALEGMVVVSFFLRGKEALYHSVINRMWTTYRKEAPEKMNESYGMGIAWGINYEAAVKDAIKPVGKNKLSREEIFNSYTNNLGGLSREGIQGPCTYGPKSRNGSMVVKFYQVQGCQIVPVTDCVQTADAVSLH